MVKEEFFIVDIFFRSGTRLLGVEMSQSAIDFYLGLDVVIVPQGSFTPPPEFFEPPSEDPPDEEEPELPPEQNIPGDAITIVINNATYGPSPTPGLERVNLKVLSRVKDKTALIKDPWLIIRVRDAITKTDIKVEQFQLKSTGISFTQDFQFDIDTSTRTIDVFVTMWEALSFPISQGRTVQLEYNPGATPPPPPGAAKGGDFFPWVIVAATGAAFISDKALQRKRRR